MFPMIALVVVIVSPLSFVLVPTLKRTLQPAQERLLAILFVLATVLFCYPVMTTCDMMTHTDAGPMGQVSLQMAYSAEKARSIVKAYSRTQHLIALFELGFDFLFSALYGIALMLVGIYFNFTGKLSFCPPGVGARACTHARTRMHG